MDLLDTAMAASDTVMASLPRRMPEYAAIQRCRIISHRGEHDNLRVRENTLPAFRAAADAGVWGLECDIRWTADLVPVICHDPDLRRVFGHGASTGALRFSELRALCPALPSLREVIEEFGGRCHLMLELKAEAWPRPSQQQAILQQLLASLEPGRDYHFLSLHTELFDYTAFAPPSCLLPVAQTNVRRLSRLALQRGYAGLAGHYLLLNNRLKCTHEAAGQRIGSGFPASANCLRRELNRGVEWIFSNRAVALQGLRDTWLQR